MAAPPPTPETIPVLYRDEHLVAVHKPGGLLVHRTRESTDTTALLQILRDQLDQWLYPVHRLDRATSGVIVFALSSEDAAALQAALEDSTKHYLTLVRGSTPEVFESRRPLSDRPAHSSFVKLAELARCSLLRAQLHTGRRHQLRRHLAHLAHQVIGDTTYGKGKINRELRAAYGLPRMVLHAERLRFAHPVSGVALDLYQPLADDLREYLERLPGFDEAMLSR